MKAQKIPESPAASVMPPPYPEEYPKIVVPPPGPKAQEWKSVQTSLGANPNQSFVA